MLWRLPDGDELYRQCLSAPERAHLFFGHAVRSFNCIGRLRYAASGEKFTSTGTGEEPARQCALCALCIDQHCKVLNRKSAGKSATRSAVVFDLWLVDGLARNQTWDLHPAVASQALQVSQFGTAIRTRKGGVVKALENGLDPLKATLVASGRLDLQNSFTGHHPTHFLKLAHLGFVHLDHHRIDYRAASKKGFPQAPDRPTSGTFQAHSSMESRARLEAHSSLEKTGG
jgi:hypothetical protein